MPVPLRFWFSGTHSVHSSVQPLLLFHMCYGKLQIATFNLWNLAVPFCSFNSFSVLSSKDLVAIDSQQDTALVLTWVILKTKFVFLRSKMLFSLKPAPDTAFTCNFNTETVAVFARGWDTSQRWHLLIVSEKDIFLNWGMVGFADGKTMQCCQWEGLYEKRDIQ